MIVRRGPCEDRKREILPLLEGQDATPECLHGLTLYVLVGDRVAATGTCFRVPGPILMVDFIAVHEAFRGEATTLLSALLEEARLVRDENGYRLIYLTSPDPSLPDLVGEDVWAGETGQVLFDGSMAPPQDHPDGPTGA